MEKLKVFASLVVLCRVFQCVKRCVLTSGSYNITFWPFFGFSRILGGNLRRIWVKFENCYSRSWGRMKASIACASSLSSCGAFSVSNTTRKLVDLESWSVLYEWLISSKTDKILEFKPWQVQLWFWFWVMIWKAIDNQVNALFLILLVQIHQHLDLNLMIDLFESYHLL